MPESMFPALLKFWRVRKGYSQLELAGVARVSTRHISFLETGRARPSEEMVLRLMDALGVPLRDQNNMLRTADFPPRYAEPKLTELSSGVEWALERMLRQQEPYPLTVLSVDYDIVRSNSAASRVFGEFVAMPSHLSEPLNMYTLLFDPFLVRPFVQDWPLVAAMMVARLHREAFQHSGDERLVRLLDRVLRYPKVPAAWRQPDFSLEMESTMAIRLQRGDLQLGFLTTLTSFSAPLLVTLQELRIESYFPLDASTQAACERIASDQPLAPQLQAGPAPSFAEHAGTAAGVPAAQPQG
jgi:transcriptional regulator with XRE-family HTH domain